MIEPLRYSETKAPTYSLEKAALCSRCLLGKKTKLNPSLAIKYCKDCTRSPLLCEKCDDHAHSFANAQHHIRRIIVVGPGVRKKIIRRGDSRTFPRLFDTVEIKLKAKVYQSGQLKHEEPVQFLRFPSGVSGTCVHIQILGGKKLPIADSHGSSDPFVVVKYGEHRIGTTRTRPRTLNPRWDNETFIIPTDDVQLRVGEKKNSRSEILKLEVYDRDYLNFNDFLGHVELSRHQLLELAKVAGQRAIRLNLSLREYHGNISIQCGMNASLFYLKILEGNSLDSMDAFGLSDPYCELYFANRYIGKTSVCDDTLDPVWTSGNVFTLRVKDVLREEKRILELINFSNKLKLNNRRLNNYNNNTISTEPPKKTSEETNMSMIFRLEIYDHNTFRGPKHMGTVRIPVDQLRKMIPDFPQQESDIPKGSFAVRQQYRLMPALTKDRGKKQRSMSIGSIFFKQEEDKEEKNGDDIEDDRDIDIFDDEYINSKRLMDSDNPKLSDNQTSTHLGTQAQKYNPTLLEGVNDHLADSDDILDNTEPVPQPPMPVLLFDEDGNEIVGDSRAFESALQHRREAFVNNADLKDIVSSRIKTSFGAGSVDNGNDVDRDGRLEQVKEGRLERGQSRLSHHEEEDADQYGEDDDSEEGDNNNNNNNEVEEEEEEQSDNEETSLLSKPKSSLLEESVQSSLDKQSSVEFEEEPSHAPENDEYDSVLDKVASFISSALKLNKNKQDSENNTNTHSILLGSAITWSKVAKFTVTKDATLGQGESKFRGQLIVRLLLSTRGHIIRGLDLGVQHMTLGETSTIKVRYDYAYGNFWMGAHILPRSNMIFTVKLLTINGSGGIEQMPWRSLLRFTRMIRRRAKWLYMHLVIIASYVYNGIHRFYLYLTEKPQEIIEDYESSSSEEIEEVQSEETESSVSDEDSVIEHGAVLAGMGVMWGYDPSKRPKKEKRHKRTKEQKMKDKEEKRLRMLALMGSGSESIQSQDHNDEEQKNDYDEEGYDNDNMQYELDSNDGRDMRERNDNAIYEDDVNSSVVDSSSIISNKKID